MKIGKVFAELLPVVGEGITGSPVIASLSCPSGGRGPKVGVIPDGGPAMVLNPDGSSCLGELQGKPIGMQSDIPTGNPLRADLLTLPAVGHPAFGNVGGGTSLLAPTTGLLRALDLTVNEYQGGEDSVSAWDPASGQLRLGFPARQNDLSFLSGPSVGDVGGAPGEEVVAASAHLDLNAFGARRPAGRQLAQAHERLGRRQPAARIVGLVRPRRRRAAGRRRRDACRASCSPTARRPAPARPRRGRAFTTTTPTPATCAATPSRPACRVDAARAGRRARLPRAGRRPALRSRGALRVPDRRGDVGDGRERAAGSGRDGRSDCRSPRRAPEGRACVLSTRPATSLAPRPCASGATAEARAVRLIEYVPAPRGRLSRKEPACSGAFRSFFRRKGG